MRSERPWGSDHGGPCRKSTVILAFTLSKNLVQGRRNPIYISEDHTGSAEQCLKRGVEEGASLEAIAIIQARTDEVSDTDNSRGS